MMKNACICLLWLVLTGAGFLFLLAYESKPNGNGQSKSSTGLMWPSASKIERSKNGSTLLMFIHPKCPCTAASLTELSILMSRADSANLKTYAVFLRPRGADATWRKTSHWLRASAIPGVTVLADEGGREAKLFDAKTSGETLLFDRSGRLAFAGGITGGRGHEGDNQGLSAVLAILERTDKRCTSTNVFGCSLENPLALKGI